jgi:predicted secreted protein
LPGGSGFWSEVVMAVVTTRERKLETLRRALPDERSGRVVFVSHCLLNQNVRYLGGATRSGAIDEVVAGLTHAGVGLVQMPCPEECAWGGVCKRHTIAAYGADHTGLRWVRRPATGLFLAYTRLAYRRLARRVSAQIADYVRSGYTVESVVGVGGSPSCGVHTTLDLPAVLDDIAGREPAQLDSREFNQHVIAGHAQPGQGMFIAALHRRLKAKGVEVRLDEHDLIAEIGGATSI